MSVMGYKKLKVIEHGVRNNENTLCGFMGSYHNHDTLVSVILSRNIDFGLHINLYAEPRRGNINYGNRLRLMQECE